MPTALPVDVSSYPAAARDLAARAERYLTPCGEGAMSWHVWGDGPPLVLLHGGSGSWTHWVRNLEALMGRYRVLAADLPGLGESDHPPFAFDHDDLAGSVGRWAEVVLDGIHQLVDAPYHLAGFSFGSITGAWIAAHHDTPIRSLTVVGGASLGMPWAGLRGSLKPMARSMSEAQCRAVQAHNLGVMMLHNRDEIDDDDAGALQLHNARRARVRSHPLASGDVLRRAVPEVSVPLSFIWGAQDIYALPDIEGRIEFLRQHHPDLAVTLIADAGHWVMYERARECTEAMLAAFERAE